ncbi:hypothetical protein V2W45_1466590 [Cenococcum geophilum]
MDGDVLNNVYNILSLKLNKLAKEKYAMFINNTKPLYGFIRVQISLLLLLSVAIATRPGALVESASIKGNNKAVYEKRSNKSIIIVNVNLEHIKNKKKDSKPKKFTFRFKDLPTFCIVLHILAIGVNIFNLKVPAHRDVLYIKWKNKVLD